MATLKSNHSDRYRLSNLPSPLKAHSDRKIDVVSFGASGQSIYDRFCTGCNHNRLVNLRDLFQSSRIGSRHGRIKMPKLRNISLCCMLCRIQNSLEVS